MHDRAATLPGLFGDALVINLAERTDRRTAAEREFYNAGWSVKFFPACRFDDPAGFDSAGWRGCFYSHLECLKFAEQKGLENILIFEDDIALTSSINRLTTDIAKTISRLEWDLLYFGHERSGEISRADGKTTEVTFERCDIEISTTHFYAVNKRVIRRLIEHFERNARTVPSDGRFGPMSPDGSYNTFRRYNRDVVTYIASPKLGWQRPSRSDLTPRGFDNIKVLRLALNYARNFKHFLDRHRSG